MKTRALLCLHLLLGFVVWAQDESAWIVFDRDSVDAVTRQFKTWQAPITLSDLRKEDPVAVALVPKADLPRLTALFHDQFNRCGGYTVHTSEAEAQAVKTQLAAVQAKAALSKRAYTIDNPTAVNAMEPLVLESTIFSVIEQLSSYQNRFYNSQHGVDAAHWLRDHWTGLTLDVPGATVELVNHSFVQPSVVLTITGSEFPNEIVVLGGHLDSTNRSSSLAPGADDDASGIACLTEVIRIVAETGFTPKRTLKFMGYAGEEAGLLGSADIAATHRAANANVIGVLQLDMTNYQGSVSDMYLMTDYTNANQNTFVTQLAQTYLPDITVGTDRCGYGCSDHASWHREGFIASIPFESRMGEHNNLIHSASDTLASMGNEASHSRKFARLALCYVAELAKGEVTQRVGPYTATIDIRTMVSFIDGYGVCSPTPCDQDLDQNGAVNAQDLRQLFGDWTDKACYGFLNGPTCIP